MNRLQSQIVHIGFPAGAVLRQVDAELWERVAVEHTLAHVGHWQGRRARYRGDRRNVFDLRRCGVVRNAPVIARLEAFSQAAR